LLIYVLQKKITAVWVVEKAVNQIRPYYDPDSWFHDLNHDTDLDFLNFLFTTVTPIQCSRKRVRQLKKT